MARRASLRYTSRPVTPNDENPPWGRLVQADALALAGSLDSGTVDLVYLDPPFGTGTTRRMLPGRAGGGIAPGEAYADPRTDPAAQLGLWQEVRRVLRPGGAFFLHLDWRTVHASKLLLDGVFGADNFLNEIIWHYATGGIPTRWFARKHDTILYYVHGSGHTFRRLEEKKYLAHKMSRKGVPEYQDERGWYRYRSLDDVWEIPWLTQDAKERTGYPTQKPVALLTRILEACTEPADLVADFCCGSGTTAVAAMRLGRRWIVGDRSPQAVAVARRRIIEERDRLVALSADAGGWPAGREILCPGDDGSDEGARPGLQGRGGAEDRRGVD